MGFKDLFINSDSDDNKKQKVETTQNSFTSKFPSSGPVNETKSTSAPQTSTTVDITPDNPACVPHLDKIMALYEEGFNSLNMDGYDFFEYFQAVVQTGLNNPSMYGDRKSVVQGKSVDLGGRGIIKKKKRRKKKMQEKQNGCAQRDARSS